MLTLHAILIQLRNDLGYKKQDEGVCALYAQKGIDAFLVGEYESVFKPRCEYIEKNYSQLPDFLQRAKKQIKDKAHSHEQAIEAKECAAAATPQQLFTSDELQMIFEVAAFIEQGELYYNPQDYSSIFGKLLYQNSQEIANYAQSTALERLGGRAIVTSFIGIYSLTELTIYIRQLNKLAMLFKNDFALSLSNGRHNIALCYSYIKNQWTLIDANLPELSAPLGHDSLAKYIAGDILRAFGCELTTAFKSTLITTGQLQSLMQDHVGRWQHNEELIAIHDIPSGYRQRTASGMTLTLLAAGSGDTGKLNKIIKSNQTAHFNQHDKNNLIFLLFIFILTVEIRSIDALWILLWVLFEEKVLNAQFVDQLNDSEDDNRTPASCAAEKGYADALQILVEAKTSDGRYAVDLNQPRISGATPVHGAAQNNHTDVMRILIEAKTLAGDFRVNLNQPRLDGVTPVLLASAQGHANAVRLLVEAKTPDGHFRTNLNQGCHEGRTPAFEAAQLGYDSVLRVLMEAKTSDGMYRVDLNQPSSTGTTPVYMAARNAHIDALKRLVDAKTPDGFFRVNLNQSTTDMRLTPAWVAASKGDANVLRILIEAKTSDGHLRVDLNQANNFGMTPLYIAAYYGHVDALIVLIGAKTHDGKIIVNLNQPGDSGLSPIHNAILSGHLDIVRILINSGANINCLFQEMPLLRFAEIAGYADIITLIKQAIIVPLAEANIGLSHVCKMTDYTSAETASPSLIEAAIGDTEPMNESDLISSEAVHLGDLNTDNTSVSASPLVTQSIFSAPVNGQSVASNQLEISDLESHTDFFDRGGFH